MCCSKSVLGVACVIAPQVEAYWGETVTICILPLYLPVHL